MKTHLLSTTVSHFSLQVMLEKPGSLAVQSLVLNYVGTRGYHDSSAAEHQQSSWSDEEDERYKHREGEREPAPFDCLTCLEAKCTF